jgi:hypothetical protein
MISAISPGHCPLIEKKLSMNGRLSLLLAYHTIPLEMKEAGIWKSSQYAQYQMTDTHNLPAGAQGPCVAGRLTTHN